MSNNPDPYSPCPCSSGKKYKFCCRETDKAAAEAVARAEAPPLIDRRSQPYIRMGFKDDKDDDVPRFSTPARREAEGKGSRGRVAKMTTFVQPLLEACDGSEEEVEGCFLLGGACWELALLELDQEEEEAEIRKLAAQMQMPTRKDRADFVRIVRQMISRHREMFPEEYSRDDRR